MLSRLCQFATRRKDALATCSHLQAMMSEQATIGVNHDMVQQPFLVERCTQSNAEGFLIHRQRGIATLIGHGHRLAQHVKGLQNMTVCGGRTVDTTVAQMANNQSAQTCRLIPRQCSVWNGIMQQQQVRFAGQLSRVRVPKSAAIDDRIMPNTTDLKYGLYGIRALTGKRVAANTIEAMRRTLRRRLKKTAALWIRIAATVPVTRKPEGIRMGKGKGVIDFYACAVRPGQIIAEMDRVPRPIALSALAAVQPKFPCKLAFVEWS